ncbi:MAG: hypothetical protein Q4G46_15950, partial [Propionibacteriaceae bacterium]|nr:hypothetical protein [Propionibacteriaceae bacterium]
TTNPVAPTTTTRPATTTASRPTVTSVTTSAPRPTGTGAVPTTPGTNPTASGPIAVADHGRNTFGFRVTGQVPAGTRLVVSWEREGVNQRTVTTNMYWWSGNQSGYRNARAELVDASGKVFALSDRISTRP